MRNEVETSTDALVPQKKEGKRKKEKGRMKKEEGKGNRNKEEG